jgi:ParB-like chromosome segregation protein Spo0J
VSAVSDEKVSKTAKEKAKGMGSTKSLRLEDIWVGARMRPVNAIRAKDLLASLQEIGLNTALSVRASSDLSKTGSRRWTLVAGAHRLEAARKLGWKTIRCEIFTGTEAEARIWEIRENLDRAELTALEKAEHVAGLIRIKMEEEVSSQGETKPRQGGRPEGGLRAAARTLGIDKTEASRSLKIAGLPVKVKAALRGSKVEDNQTALLKIANLPTEAPQLWLVAEMGKRGSRRRPAGGRQEGDISERNRRNLWQALVAMTAKHLGKDANRFAKLARDLGKSQLIEFAAAIETRRIAQTKGTPNRPSEPKLL